MVVRGEEMVAMEGVKGEAVYKLDVIVVVVVVMKLLATAVAPKSVPTMPEDCCHGTMLGLYKWLILIYICMSRYKLSNAHLPDML